MDEKGFATKLTQDTIIEKLSDLLEAKEIAGIKAKLIVTGASLLLRIGDDVMAENVENEELKSKCRKVLEDIIVNGDVDITELVDLALELIELFKKK